MHATIKSQIGIIFTLVSDIRNQHLLNDALDAIDHFMNCLGQDRHAFNAKLNDYKASPSTNPALTSVPFIELP